MKSLKAVALTAVVLASIAGSAFAKTVDNEKHIESTETIETAQIRCPVLWRC